MLDVGSDRYPKLIGLFNNHAWLFFTLDEHPSIRLNYIFPDWKDVTVLCNKLSGEIVAVIFHGIFHPQIESELKEEVRLLHHEINHEVDALVKVVTDLLKFLLILHGTQFLVELLSLTE